MDVDISTRRERGKKITNKMKDRLQKQLVCMSCRIFLFLQALFVQHKGTNTRKCISFLVQILWTISFSSNCQLPLSFFFLSFFLNFLNFFYFILFVEYILAFSWTLYRDCSLSRLREEQQLFGISKLFFFFFRFH